MEHQQELQSTAEPSELSVLFQSLVTKMDSKFAEQSLLIEGVKTHLDQRITALQTLAENNKRAITLNVLETGKATQMATQNKSDIADLQTIVDSNIEYLKKSNASLKTEVTSLHNTVALQAIKLKVQRVRTEDQTNRALRKTIIIRGIPEPIEESNWTDTRRVASAALATATGSTSDEISLVIERIHRGGPFKKNSKAPRKIHACLYDWNEIEELRKSLRLHGRQSGIYIDNHYGPDTSFRRSLALKLRRELLDNNTIAAGYVGFPAKLFVKYKKTDEKFIQHEDYSTRAVILPEEEQYESQSLFDNEEPPL